MCKVVSQRSIYFSSRQAGACWFLLGCNKHPLPTVMHSYTDCSVCSGSGAVTSSHAALQHLLHNLCCDWQASINLGSLCSIIISPAIQLDSSQQSASALWSLTKEIPSKQPVLVASSMNLLWAALVNTAASSVSLINWALCYDDVDLIMKWLNI